MKDLVARFLSEEERARIQAAVQEAEKDTSGEIVPMVVSESHDYPVADIVGGVAFSLPLSLILAPLVGRWFWIGSQNMWLFLGFLIPLFFMFHRLVRHTPGLKRLFVPQGDVEEEVKEAALVSFFEEGLYRTRDMTGVLIFISIFEHKVWVLADHGINEKVEQKEWDEIVSGIVGGIRERRQADAICEAVKRAGDLLKTHFPSRAGDTDELKNLIV